MFLFVFYVCKCILFIQSSDKITKKNAKFNFCLQTICKDTNFQRVKTQKKPPSNKDGNQFFLVDLVLVFEQIPQFLFAHAGQQLFQPLAFFLGRVGK